MSDKTKCERCDDTGRRRRDEDPAHWRDCECEAGRKSVEERVAAPSQADAEPLPDGDWRKSLTRGEQIVLEKSANIDALFFAARLAKALEAHDLSKARIREIEVAFDGLEQELAAKAAECDAIRKHFMADEWESEIATLKAEVETLRNATSVAMQDANEQRTRADEAARLLEKIVPICDELVDGFVCDHSVGMCRCGDRSLVNEARAFLNPKPTEARHADE